MSATQQHQAKNMDPVRRKEIALQAINYKNNITELANVNQVSRKFIHAQKNKATQGITDAFSVKQDSDVLFYFPVTTHSIEMMTLSLNLDCRSNYRGIQKFFENNFDYSKSLGSIHNLMQEKAISATQKNKQQDLSAVRLGANDELFFQNQPILSGVDIDSLYCYLLQQERSRDGETWAVNLLDLQQQGYEPERVIADDGDGLRAGHKMIFDHIPCDYDNFHLSRDMKDLRRYFRNRLKSSKTNCAQFARKAQFLKKKDDRDNNGNLLIQEQQEEEMLSYLSPTIDTLISWMEHDVLNMPGSPMKERQELFDFILCEFEKLAEIHPHRIGSICTKLRKQRDGLLAFVGVLDSKFYHIAKKHQCSLDDVWEICALQRCEYSGDTYHFRSEKIVLKLTGDLFEKIEDDVLDALDTTERTSSMVENLNGRVKSYLRNRKECNQNFLNLLRFYLNHTPLKRSARKTRLHKSPSEILTGNKHPHWLEMLGYTRFQRKAA